MFFLLFLSPLLLEHFYNFLLMTTYKIIGFIKFDTEKKVLLSDIKLSVFITLLAAINAKTHTQKKVSK